MRWFARQRNPLKTTAAIAVLLLVTGCQPAPTDGVVDQNRAVEIAGAFVVAGQPSDFVFLDLTNEAPTLLGRKWRVKVDAHVRIPQSPPTDAFLHFIIDVDRATGVPTIFAQG